MLGIGAEIVLAVARRRADIDEGMGIVAGDAD
jgi:hypothetical protein